MPNEDVGIEEEVTYLVRFYIRDTRNSWTERGVTTEALADYKRRVNGGFPVETNDGELFAPGAIQVLTWTKQG